MRTTHSLPVLAATEDRHVQEQMALIRSLLLTLHHFWGGPQALFRHVTDPRHPSYITYPLPAILMTGLCLFLFRLAARRQVTLLLRHSLPASATFQALFGVPAWPHGDTIDAVYARLQVSELQEVVTTTVETLIRKKVLYSYRLFERYFLVSIDGTGMLTFSHRHCPHCMTMTQHGHTTYYHPVLEAKLVTHNGLVCSLMTEFIENPSQYPTKQDCELKAFYRLAQRLKQRFPRLPLCLLLDGLFAGGPTFSICEQAGWKYLVVLREDDLPSVQGEFNALLPLFPDQHLRFQPAQRYRVVQDFAWINDIAYCDTDNHLHQVSVLRCLETQAATSDDPTTTRFKWISNFHLTAANVTTLANRGGRLRWKIENEGFNVQKNGGYALEHIYSHHPVSAKIFYLLLQLAHTLAQLLERGSPFRQTFPAGVGSARNLAWRLLEAWRNLRLSDQQIQSMLTRPVQIRLGSP